MLEIRRVVPGDFYPAGNVTYKCKGAWVLFINDEPFMQTQTLSDMFKAVYDFGLETPQYVS